MKKNFIFLISFFIFLSQSAILFGQSTCTTLCSEIWWQNSSLNEIEANLASTDNINLRDDYGFRALHFAVINGEKNKVKILLSMGADTNLKTDYGFTPIYFAVGKSGDPEIIKMLIKHGAKLDVKNKNGITPLHYAAWGTPKKIRILIEAGADINAKSNSGKTAFDLAMDNEQLVNSSVYMLLKPINQ